MSQDGSPRLRVAPESIPFLLLVGSLALLLSAVGYLLWVSHGRDLARFQSRIQKAVDEIDERLESRLALIRATRGLFTASETVSRDEFRTFVDSLNLAQRYPGIQGLGYARLDGPDRIAIAFREGYGAPPATLDEGALLALKRARDDGVPAASRPGGGTGFLVFAPVYRRGLAVATVDHRRAAVEGYVFASMDAVRLLQEILDAEDAEEIALRIDPGSMPGVHPSDAWSESRSLTFAGQPWTVLFQAKPAFQARSAGGPILFLLLAGLGFCAALFAISRSQVRARATAERLATRWSHSARALLLSENRGRRIIDAALDAIIGFDREGRIIEWNPRAAELFGWSEEEAVGKPLLDTILPAQYRLSGLSGRIELTALRKDRSEFPVEMAFTTIGTGPQASTIAFIRDLTDSRRAEASLRESLDRFRIAAGTTTDLIYEWRPDSGRVEWFGDVESILGLVPDSRAAWEELIHPEDLERFRVSKGFSEYRIRRRDGSWRTWTDRAQSLVEGDGRPVRWIGSIDDVTDRRSLERERERLLNRVQMQMERMPVACLLTGPDFKIRFWNPAAARIFGYSREEAMGRPFAELLLPAGSRDQAAAYLRSLVEGRHSSITTWENVTRDGLKLLCEWHAGPLEEADGSFAGLQAMAIDTTERARLEGRMRQSQKLEAIGRLAGGIAHDFNNLLTSVSGYGDLLLERFSKDDPAREQVEAIRDAGRRAADLTRQLLAFSKRQVLEPTVLDLNAVLREMESLLRRVIGEDIDLGIALDPALGPVKADRGQVEQVVMNLVMNARDAMPKGGRLRIETRNVQLDAEYAASHPDASPGPHVELAVVDSGEGIPAEVMPRLFEPFFTTKERGKGTGLGLATVYGILQQSGGHIAATSEPGRGTVFRVFLPRVDQEVAAKPAPAAPKAPVNGTETILLVEDEAPVRKLLSQILKGRGYTVIEAGTGVDALESLSRHPEPIHLMVTDIIMPGMSGRELSRKVEPLRPEIKVLYISGYTDDALANHGQLDPGTAFLAKPFTPTALASKVREVLETSSKL